jgi:hypothetical protein
MVALDESPQSTMDDIPDLDSGNHNRDGVACEASLDALFPVSSPLVWERAG